MKLTPEQRQELLQIIRIEPCHVTGMHDPTHTTKYVCEGQTHAAFERLLAWLGVSLADLPRSLHGIHEGDCYWCHGVPSQEVYRVERRELHQWAGVEVPKELAEPAADAEKKERKI